MYKVHQDAVRLPVELSSPQYAHGEHSMPVLSVSASRDETGDVHVSIINAHAREASDLTCELRGVEVTKVAGRILTSSQLDAHNTFDEPDRLKPVPFNKANFTDGKLKVEVPPRAVIVLQLSKG